MAILLRQWLDESGLGITGLIAKLTPDHFANHSVPARATVSDWLGGVALRWDFAEAVIEICSPGTAIARARRQEARDLWDKAETARRRLQQNDQPVISPRHLSRHQLLSWLSRPLVGQDEGQQEPEGANAGRTIREIAQEATDADVADIVDALMDSIHPRTWLALLKELRVLGKKDHALLLVHEIGKRGDSHRVPSIVEFLRTEGRFGDEVILIDAIAEYRNADFILQVLRALRADRQLWPEKVLGERVGVKREPSETLAILSELRERKEFNVLRNVLLGAAKWREPTDLAQLIKYLRENNMGEVADLLLMAAGSERGASSFGHVVMAVKETCRPEDVVKLAHAAVTQRAAQRLGPLVNTIDKSAVFDEGVRHILTKHSRMRYDSA
ncbi:hypothetical protein GCM10010425_50550 [Streptomyces spororaveus]|uniref:HEAT repeat protein n=1 Tax=Streptomyces spororaveus TaxID=284039 RepID=A0ABQ3T2N9_9ACTN|nr:hypothetical protein [Streptomyces spororaveus]GHI74649.1 hypothetical protein Sspor_02100 [Streptomyces spororaveus]